jgi:predicted Rossmann-fold nucleotide-binding protein
VHNYGQHGPEPGQYGSYEEIFETITKLAILIHLRQPILSEKKYIPLKKVLSNFRAQNSRKVKMA